MIDTQLYLARDEDGRDVALKVGRAGSDASALFAHEALILRVLDGRVTPRVIEVGEADGRTYLAVSWHPGADAESAAAELRRLPRADGRVQLLELGDRIIGAYAEIHGQGVLHGDVHPNNVLVAGDGSVTVIDFGLATMGDERGVPRGGVDFFMEPKSAAAQQAGRGASALTAAGEQYGLGAMLYRLLTGGYTHSFSLEPDEMRRQLLTDAPLPFASHDADDMPAVEAVLRRALSKDPAERFARIADLLGAYRAAVSDDLARAGRGARRRAQVRTRPTCSWARSSSGCRSPAPCCRPPWRRHGRRSISARPGSPTGSCASRWHEMTSDSSRSPTRGP